MRRVAATPSRGPGLRVGDAHTRLDHPDRQRRWRSNERPDRGAAAVEFALVLPLVLFILFGVVDFGRAYMAQIALTQAAREGVRVAALDPAIPAADVEARVDAAATPLDASKVSATLVTSCAGATAGSNAEVTASMTFEFVTPIGAVAQLVGGSGSLGNNINLVGRGVMRCYG